MDQCGSDTLPQGKVESRPFADKQALIEHSLSSGNLHAIFHEPGGPILGDVSSPFQNRIPR